ncbi:hypothetical protein TNCV_4339491 [Trichonephila clavipes]|nr:hypothetical protein TNCV_4339491 [Trichonephila clavipes]
MIKRALEWEHRPGVQNVMADVLSRNLVESRVGENIACAVIRDLVLSSREQLISEQRQDSELSHIYRYLENLMTARLMRQSVGIGLMILD